MWNKIEDGLPGEIGPYLVFTEDNFTVWAFFNSKKQFCESNRYVMNVTHWMPLPSPPTADKGGPRQQTTNKPSTPVCPYCYGRGLQNTGCTEFTTEPCYTCKGTGKPAHVG